MTSYRHNLVGIRRNTDKVAQYDGTVVVTDTLSKHAHTADLAKTALTRLMSEANNHYATARLAYTERLTAFRKGPKLANISSRYTPHGPAIASLVHMEGR